MESVTGCLDRPNAFQKIASVQGNTELLPRPCSMPNFDRKVDDGVKRGIQTLPVKRSAKRGLVGIFEFFLFFGRLKQSPFVCFWKRARSSISFVVRLLGKASLLSYF